MNGAGWLLSSLVDVGVDVCFANPGTSEMHIVAALDEVRSMRGILTLYEGVATGAADGYGRVTGRPAVALLHLGPGLANGLANLHNARRARTPLLAVVGDHASSHARYDTPLQSDIEALAGTVSRRVVTSRQANELGADAVAAVRAAGGPPPGVATLIVPADVSWSEVTDALHLPSGAAAAPVASPRELESTAAALRQARSPVILLGGPACSAAASFHAARCAEATGARLLSETFPPLSTRGAGTAVAERLSYLGEFAALQLEGSDLILTVSAAPPASFFAYPEARSDLIPEGAEVLSFVGPEVDVAASLEALAEELGASPSPMSTAPAGRPDRPSGPLSTEGFAAAIGNVIDESTIVVDESNTAGIHLWPMTSGCPPHEWMTLTGGAIGYGLPAAVGAAIGRPESRVLCLESDGSAMYGLQALWTMARERLKVTTVLLSNRSYAILTMELARVGSSAPGSVASSMLELTDPELDFVSLAEAMGVPARKVHSGEALLEALAASLDLEGPMLIEAVLPQGLS
jgi:acetolactate synthase-1/2/3 large subunit